MSARALELSAGKVGFVGAQALEMSVSRVQVELNQVLGLAPALDAARYVVDFAASPLAVPTGTDQSRSLDLAGDRGELIRASADVTLKLGDFFYTAGSLGFEKSTQRLTLDDGSRISHDVLTVGGSGLQAFAGLDGGPLVDSNQDGRIDSQDRPGADAVGFSLADCARIREQVAGVTVNDIFLAAAGGALRKYLEIKGELPAASLNAMMPLSTRDEHTAGDAGNQLGMTVVPLGSDIADPLERLHAVHRAASCGKSLAAALGREFPARLLEALPAMVVEQVARRALVPMVNAVVSNVRGPDLPLYLAGARLQMFAPLSIIIDGIGLNITGFSYNGKLWVCFVSCRKMLPDPGLFGQCLNESFAELVDAATAGAKAAHPPVAGAPARRKTGARAPAGGKTAAKKAVPAPGAAGDAVPGKPVARKRAPRKPAPDTEVVAKPETV